MLSKINKSTFMKAAMASLDQKATAILKQEHKDVAFAMFDASGARK